MAKLTQLMACSFLLLVLAGTSLADQANTVLQPVLSASSPALVSPPAAPASNGFPVLFADSEIIVVSTSPIGSLKPQDRARLILHNIQAFADSTAASASLKVIARPEGLGLGDADILLLVITDADAEMAGIPAAELASQVLARVQSAVDHYRTTHSWKTYGLAAAFTALSILGLWLALHINNKAFALLASKLARLEKIWKREVRFRDVKVLSAVRIEHTLLLILRFLRILVMLLCWYIFLLLILSFFPQTRKFGAKILDYLLTPFASIFHTVISYIPISFSSSSSASLPSMR